MPDPIPNNKSFVGDTTRYSPPQIHSSTQQGIRRHEPQIIAHRFNRAGLIISLIITVFIGAIIYGTLIRTGTPSASTITPTPQIPQPVVASPENIFVAGQTWKGTNHANNSWYTGQATLNVDTINSDGEFTGTLSTDDYGTPPIKGNIVHDFSDIAWQTILRYQGMDPKTPGVWLTFLAHGFDYSNTPFYAVVRDNGSLDGYWLGVSSTNQIDYSTPAGEIHLQKTL